MQRPTYWMGVDLGNARVGIALSDPDLSLATPWGNVPVYADYFEALDDLVDLVQAHQVSRVVVGYPLSMDGSEGKAAKKARRWASQLFKRLNPLTGRVPVDLFTGGVLSADSSLPTGENPAEDGPIGLTDPEQPRTIEVTLVDERLTTVSAHHQLAQAGRGSRQHRAVVDQQAAVLILQSALDRRRHGKEGA